MDTAIVRVERLYPLPVDEIKAELARYPSATQVVWVQDEPKNMGAWPFMALALPPHLDGPTLSRVSRSASSSPAAGSIKKHETEQQALLAQLFGEL
jgi:2-oxoglutarate dehydrogenase E1 component